MKSQPTHTDNWDYLIILDACRYDKFKKHYKKHLEGDLEKVKSPGSATPEWLDKTFSGKRYNYQYITANPYINKEGLLIDDMVQHYNEQWYAGDKFTEINQAWLERWDQEIGTVHPQKLREYSEEKISGDRPSIIHFIQPHRPFISYKGEDGHDWYNRRQALINDEDDGNSDKSLKFKFFNKTRPLWSPFFHALPERVKSDLRGFFGMGNDYRQFIKEIGQDEVENLYEQDLNLALEQVSKLVESLDGSVVVTADHGESWGNQYEWGHPIGSDNPVLREVPWLEVKN